MAIAHLLEDFEVAAVLPEPEDPDADEAAEEQRLAVFEQGYSAGWDDAIAAHADDHARATGALARSLEDMSFGYHEALSQMLATVEPLVRALTEKVLPAALRATLGEHLVELALQMAENRAAQPVEIVLPACASAAIRPVLDRELAMPVQVVEDPDLDPDRAYVRLGAAEREVDCARLLAALGDAAAAFLHHATEDISHG